jgi:hypothetical protein
MFSPRWLERDDVEGKREYTREGNCMIKHDKLPGGGGGGRGDLLH